MYGHGYFVDNPPVLLSTMFPVFLQPTVGFVRNGQRDQSATYGGMRAYVQERWSMLQP